MVPWISLQKSVDDASNGGMRHDASPALPPCDASDASHTDTHQGATASTRNNYAKSCKILSLLGTRERVGSRGQCGRVGWLSEGVVCTTDGLARAGAW